MEGTEEMARSEAENQQEWIINSLWTDLKVYGIILKIKGNKRVLSRGMNYALERPLWLPRC